MNIIILMFFLLINSTALSINIPNDFLYKEKIIDPNCILESNTSHTINLTECTLHKGKKITSYILEKDSIGYHYNNEENNYPGSIIYKYLGKIDNMHLVHASIIGGATSRLNYINYFKINNNTLKLIKRGPSGDRSLGGIFNAEIKNNLLTYDMSITAKLFVENFNKNREILPAFEDLPHCAICQFAIVHYSNNKIESITLNNELNSYSNNHIEQCFNNIHGEFITNKRLTISSKEATDFADMFISKCISNKIRQH